MGLVLFLKRVFKLLADRRSATLGSRGYFFLIDTEAVNAASPRTVSVDKKKISSGTQVIFLSSALCASLTRLRREPSVSIRKKYPLEPRLFFSPRRFAPR